MPRVSNAFEDYRSFIKPLNKKINIIQSLLCHLAVVRARWPYK